MAYGINTTSVTATSVIDYRHPSYYQNSLDWEKWRLTYCGGTAFRNRYLKQYSSRESADDFNLRRQITPIPAFAKTAIQEIRNSIFQRMRDIVRRDGSRNYMQAINGFNGGVDRRGATMNSFIGHRLLDELLMMGRVGVYVDAPATPGGTLADSPMTPYLYPYQIEDILAWQHSSPEEISEFKSLLVRDTVCDYDAVTLLPTITFKRFRRLWINEETGKVNVQFYDITGQEVDAKGKPSGPVELNLERIPFVLLDIGDSLLKDVCDYQIALLNLVSQNVSYDLRANFPFYVEQRDMRKVGGHLKPAANSDGTATAGGQGASDGDIQVGSTVGRAYDKDTNAPTFIAPPSEPLLASLQLQEKLENDIRKNVSLAVANLSVGASAESKTMDNQGLEAGLSFIGLMLNSAERQITEYWAAYESLNPAGRTIATIIYPERYSLKSDRERLDDATELTALSSKVPGRTFKREVSKAIVHTLLGGRVSVEVLDKIESEIDGANYTTSDPLVIIPAKDAGLVGEQTASIALGFDDNEYKTAQQDHMARVQRIAETQGVVADAAARGVPDLGADPNAGAAEKTASRNTDTSGDTKPPVRGPGK
jgi:hypothetical protein